jgi:glycerol-1-phosphate dehydrogenase [NAD(P)+]
MSGPLPYPEPRLPTPTYGRGLVEELPPVLLENPIVLTQPKPWPLLAHTVGPTAQVHLVETMNHAEVMEVSSTFAPGSAVMGIGGGLALAHARFVAWRRELPLVLVPSVLSSDTGYIRKVEVQEGRSIRSLGLRLPDHLLIDYGILKAAPALRNRAGAGAILSIYSALWDWEAAGRREGEFYDQSVARAARSLLARLFDGASELSRVSDSGLHLLSELHLGLVRLCEMTASSRPGKGSEQALTTYLSARPGRPIVRGQLEGLSVLLAGLAQGRDVSPAADYLKRLKLDCSPANLGIPTDELKQALLQMGRFVRQDTRFNRGIFHFREDLSEAEVDEIMDGLAAVV